MGLLEAKEILNQHGYKVIKENFFDDDDGLLDWAIRLVEKDHVSIKKMKETVLSRLKEENLLIDDIDHDLMEQLYGDDAYEEYENENYWNREFTKLKPEERWRYYMEDLTNEGILNDLIHKGYVYSVAKLYIKVGGR